MWQARDESRCQRYNMDGVPLALAERRQSAWFMVDRTLEFMRRERVRPFLAFCSFYEPHAPFAFPASFLERVDPAALELPAAAPDELRRNVPALFTRLQARIRQYGPDSEQDLRGLIASYLRCVAWLDSQVGRLLRELEASGLAENTIVVFWSDHGFLLGERGLTGKNAPLREVTQAPLIFSGPGITARDVEATVRMLDVFPTLCELTGTARPEGLSGRSLAAALAGGELEPVPAYCEFVGQWASLQTESWKLVLGTDRSAGFDQLYDLEHDPAERVNRFGDSELRETVKELTASMRDTLLTSPPDWMPRERWMTDENPMRSVRWAISRIEPDDR